MASSITEGQIQKLHDARYLSSDIAHRLPDEGELIPTPRPHERVVFLPHFLRGLGFPLHPFFRGLMFYYGLDFHDLAPNFIPTSRRLSLSARPSSASSPTSGCGSRPSVSSRWL